MFEQINSLNITDKASVKFGKKVTIFAEKFKLCLKKGEYYAEKLHERNLADLRSYIKSLGNEKANVDVTIINGEKQNTLRLQVDKRVIDELERKIGKENVIY